MTPYLQPKTLQSLLPTIFLAGLMISTKDRIPFNDGLGYDGNLYAEIIKDFPENLTQGRLNPYYTARIGPLAFCAALLDSLSLERSNENILYFFRISNAIILILIHLYWRSIGKTLKLSEVSSWVGYITLLLFYCGPRVLTYYPLQTDGFAIVLGLALAYYVLCRNLTGVLAVALLGILTWPIAHLLTAAAALSLASSPEIPKTQTKINSKSFLLLFITICAFLAIVIISLFLYAGPSPEARVRGMRVGTIRSLCGHIPMLLLVAVGTYLLFRNCIRTALVSMISTRTLPYLALSAAICCCKMAFVSYFANEALPQPKGFEVYGPFGIYGHGSPVYQLLLGRGADGKILLPLICHFLSFGPIIIYTLLSWPRIIHAARSLGFFFIFSLLLFLILSLSWESRYNQMSFPTLVVLVAYTQTNTKQHNTLDLWHLSWFLTFHLYCSRIWTSTNPIGANLSTDSFVSQAHESYLSLSGGWMNWFDYFFFGAVMLIAIITYPRQSSETP